MANASDNTSATRPTENPRFRCYYCPHTFATRQALAGHQNAHRGEIHNTTSQQQSDPNPYPYPHASLNQHAVADIPYEIGSHAFPAEFEQQHYSRPDNVAMVYNYGSQSNYGSHFAGVQNYPNQVVYSQYNGSQSSHFAGQQSYPSQEMSTDWTFAGLPIQPQPQPQPQPESQPLMDPSSPVNLDLCLGVKNTLQEPNNITKEMVAGKEDDGSSFSLSLGEKEDDDPSLSLSLKL